MSNVAEVQAKYPGFGRCIYCAATGILKDEHIIPLSLGGNIIIEKASCADCEKITSYLDGYLARNVFNEYRSHVGVTSRRKKERPTTLSASFYKEDETVIVGNYPAKEQPYTLLMPIWHLPGIALGKEPSSVFENQQSHAYWFASEEVTHWVDTQNAKLGVWVDINYSTFGRALARIAFCHAVAFRGLDSFDPLDIPALILGKYPNVPHYVGVTCELPPPPDPPNVAHKIEMQDYFVGGKSYILASVRLFAHSGYKENGMPIYRIIVGQNSTVV